MKTSPSIRLRELGIELPVLPVPKSSYLHAMRSGQLLFLSGKGVGAYTGKVGRDVSVEQACEYARSSTLVLLSVIVHELGSLDKVTQIVRVTGHVNAIPEFSEHGKVLNACSDLLIEIFGERGRHARTATGAGSSPSQIPLEIEMIVECMDERAAQHR